jgi:hypothetical protein
MGLSLPDRPEDRPLLVAAISAGRSRRPDRPRDYDAMALRDACRLPHGAATPFHMKAAAFGQSGVLVPRAMQPAENFEVATTASRGQIGFGVNRRRHSHESRLNNHPPPKARPFRILSERYNALVP